MPSTSHELFIARDHDPAMLRVAERRGEIERIRRGAYRSLADGDLSGGGTPGGGTSDGGAAVPDRWVRGRILATDTVRAVHRQLRADHWFSHLTAAMLHGSPLWRPPSGVHVTQHYRASSRAAPDLRRHVILVPPQDRSEVAGLPVTSLARTVADCVTTLPVLEGLVVADWSLGAGVDLDRVLALIADRHRGRSKGLLVMELADAGAESAWETWLRYVALWTGLPRPRTQVPIATRLGDHRVDLGWLEHGCQRRLNLDPFSSGECGPPWCWLL